MFASFYLAVLGLGPLREPLLGNIIWAAQTQGAFFNDWWWWPIEPAVAMILILGSLALINMGLDELANPRDAPIGVELRTMNANVAVNPEGTRTYRRHPTVPCPRP